MKQKNRHLVLPELFSIYVILVLQNVVTLSVNLADNMMLGAVQRDSSVRRGGGVPPWTDGRVAIKAHGFMPENGAQRHEHSDRVPYIAWAQGGYCTLTPGDVTDNGYVDNWISAGEREHDWEVLEVDYDGHNATDLAIKMCEERNNEDFCVEISQTCAGQNLAVKTFRELLLQGQIVLEESPLVLWCLANAIEIQNNYGDIKLSKKHKDDTERIDPVAAAMNALARALIHRNANDLSTAIGSGEFTL